MRRCTGWDRGSRPHIDWLGETAAGAARAMHAAVEGYAPTPVVSLPALARSLGIARLHVKDESWRFGLRAFKGLGASWALHRLLAEVLPATGTREALLHLVETPRILLTEPPARA